MPDQNAQAANGQQATVSNQPQAGAANIPTPSVTDPTSQADDSQQISTANWTLEDALRELAKVRKEAAENRVVRKQLESEKAEAERAKLSKEERLAAELADVERARTEIALKYQDRIVAYETKLAAADLGIIDPDAAMKLLDTERIEYAEDGTPKNLVKLLKELVAAKPYLAAPTAPRPVSSPANSASVNQTSARFSLSQIAQMSPAEYNKNRAAIFEAQRKGLIQPN